MAEPVQTDKEQKRLIRMAETISKALPYMRRHNDATFVVKYGGHAMTDPKLGDLVARDVVLMKQVGMNPIVVHGGGPQINKMLERVGPQERPSSTACASPTPRPWRSSRWSWPARSTRRSWPTSTNAAASPSASAARTAT
jgi:hypothetical protein